MVHKQNIPTNTTPKRGGVATAEGETAMGGTTGIDMTFAAYVAVS